jgi:SWI/SNF-related matrix-associated actin-dependent regulator 1 of chromatin subfamily A
MLVTFNPDLSQFEAVTSYFERNIPKDAGWRWDPVRKRWYTSDEGTAKKLAQYARGDLGQRLGQTDAERQALADSQAAALPEDALFDVPVPSGLDYLPYQKAGIFYALQRRGTLLADEMGLGKTVQAIGVVNGLPKASRVLIVCPASLRLNWMSEWRRWHTGAIRPVLLDAWPRFGTAGHALIVSYDSVKKWHPMIAEEAWDLLIADEAHMLKDERTRRAKALLGGIYKRREKFAPVKARRKLFLSGTAIVNRSEDVWPLVKALAPDSIGASRQDFVTRYGGNARLDELHTRLRSTIMVRRLKADVLSELPPKRRQIVLIDDHAGIVKAESAAIGLARARLDQQKAEIASLPHAEQVMRLRQCRAMALSEISRIRHDSAVAKLPAAAEHIRDALENVDKLCVWMHHRDVVAGLAAEFGAIAVTLDGSTSQENRQTAVERFQGDRRVRLFLGSIRAGGLGLTLTAAQTAIFVEFDWTPAAMMQAEDRCHRIGQTGSVLVQHLVVDGSIDAKMAKIIIGKQAMMDAALDGGRWSEDDMLDAALQYG